ncbi:MAG: hypothetical protein P0Y49_07935 [Candidatus Pedobacter colombiensis]|uniref:Uncharacterized protein n=1 Tax=Candidatus Pedobacter colombiensis TaxID=3121371 RepID=A0AAJ5W976_9SPHI|nr:hypothetical protein [Pedobacter sp.]WEK21068.1 MAG: hypothetical protein P0Y49_07935 [Pedobacter sp.]
MNYQRLLNFIVENQNANLMDFYDKSYNKLQELNKRIDRTTVSLLVIVLVYFLLATSSVESFSIGPFNIKDINLVAQLLPILFAYLLFDLLTSSIHKTEVLITVKMLFLSIYLQEVEPSDFEEIKNKHNFFTRVLLPFSFTTDLSRLFVGKTQVGLGCFGLLLSLPLLSLYLLPFVLEFFMLRDLYFNGFDNIIGKISFYMTIYINLVLIFYYIKVTLTNLKDLKEQE